MWETLCTYQELRITKALSRILESCRDVGSDYDTVCAGCSDKATNCYERQRKEQDIVGWGVWEGFTDKEAFTEDAERLIYLCREGKG